MSILIKALKKIDSDKTKQQRNVDAAAAILKTRQKSGRRRIILISAMIFAAAFVLLVAGAGIGYLLLWNQQPAAPAPAAQLPPLQVENGSASSSAMAEKSAEVPPEVPKQVYSGPSVIVVTRSGEPSKSVTKHKISRDTEIDEYGDKRTSHRVMQAMRAKQARDFSTEIEAADEQGPKRLKSVDASGAAKQAKRNINKAAADEENDSIKVTGVIWSEDRARSRAFINGASVKEGDTVNGAYIALIEQDSIRCIKNGKLFTVPVGTANE